MRRFWLIATNIVMIVYAFISLILLLSKGWNIPACLLFIINLTNLLLFQFPATSRYLVAGVCIFAGFMTSFLLTGFISIYGLILGIYGVVLIVVLIKDYEY